MGNKEDDVLACIGPYLAAFAAVLIFIIIIIIILQGGVSVVIPILRPC